MNRALCKTLEIARLIIMTEYTVDYLLSEGYCYPIAAQKRLILMDERKNVLVKHEVSQNITDVTRSRTTMQQMSVVLSSCRVTCF